MKENPFRNVANKAKKIVKVAIPALIISASPLVEVNAQDNKVKEPDPVVVYHQNDSRLKTYKDSLALFKNYQELTQALEKQNYVKSNFPSDTVGWENSKKLVKNLNFVKKYNETLYVTPDFVPGIINKTLPDQLFSNTIYPLGVEEYKAPSSLDSSDQRAGDIRKVASYENVSPGIEIIYKKGFTESCPGYGTIKIQYDENGNPLYYINQKGETMPYEPQNPSPKFTKKFAYPYFNPQKGEKTENGSKEDLLGENK